MSSAHGLLLTRRVVLIIAFIVTSIAFLLFADSQRDPSERIYSYDHLSSVDLKAYLNQYTSGRGQTCPASCPADPYSRPGMLYWSQTGDISETRWLPHPHIDDSWEVPLGYKMEDVPLKDVVPKEAFAEAGPDYTRMLHQGAGGEGEEEWDWLRNRTVLLIGSSHDRNNVDQICGQIGGKAKSWGWHTGGFCKVERLNLVFMNWFLYGMVDDEKHKFPYKDPHPNTFEERFDQVMLHAAKKDGVDRRPDLVIVSSLFWDEHFITAYGDDDAHRDRGKARGYLWQEIAWQRARVRAMVLRVREMYGEDIPIMFRTRQLRTHTTEDAMLHVYQFDQSCRAVAKDMGVRLFTWGDKLEGYAQYSDGDQHFKLGPNTYLFGDMAMFYLKRAVTPGCWGCHGYSD